jgi:hypothetical protein
MLNKLKNRYAELIEAATNRSLHKFYNWRDNNYINHQSAVQSLVRNIYMQHRERAIEGKSYFNHKEVGFSIYSQYQEDGILLWILGSIGFKTYRMVDIGSGDGIFASNAANFINNFGFDALLVEITPSGKSKADKFYSKNMMTAIYPPTTVTKAVDKDNINQIITENGFAGEIDILSLDIDSNDYWVWEAINTIKPRVVVLENNLSFGAHNVVVPYDRDCKFHSIHKEYYGSSAKANNYLSRMKGYHLVACSSFGINSFFLRNDLKNNITPEINIDEVLSHPINKKLEAVWSELKNLPFITIE